MYALSDTTNLYLTETFSGIHIYIYIYTPVLILFNRRHIARTFLFENITTIIHANIASKYIKQDICLK